MKAIVKLLMLAVVVLAVSAPMPAQKAAPAAQPSADATASSSPAAPPAAIQKRLEVFFRNLFALGPAIDVTAGTLVPGPIPNFYTAHVKITVQGQASTGTVYVSKDGRYMLRGEIQDLDGDPLADVRSQIHLDGYASWGPADAKVTIVEYGDLECPSCRQYEPVLREVRAKYPQIRFVFKDFPLEQVHPWAKTAALASHCVLQQSSDAFWKFHDSIYDHQEEVTVENAFDKLAEFAAAAGADPAAYKACIVDPATLEIVNKSQEEGHSLGVTGTPTTFVNGRRITGPDPNLLQQYIDFDLGVGASASTPAGSTPAAAQSPAASSPIGPAPAQ